MRIFWKNFKYSMNYVVKCFFISGVLKSSDYKSKIDVFDLKTSIYKEFKAIKNICSVMVHLELQINWYGVYLLTKVGKCRQDVFLMFRSLYAFCIDFTRFKTFYCVAIISLSLHNLWDVPAEVGSQMRDLDGKGKHRTFCIDRRPTAMREQARYNRKTDTLEFDTMLLSFWLWPPLLLLVSAFSSPLLSPLPQSFFSFAPVGFFSLLLLPCQFLLFGSLFPFMNEE